MMHIGEKKAIGFSHTHKHTNIAIFEGSALSMSLLKNIRTHISKGVSSFSFQYKSLILQK